MRKRRAVIYDDNPDIADMLKEHFLLRGYEVLTYQRAVNCPAYDNAACKEQHPCADIVLSDQNMPKRSGIEMLRIQARNGCRVPAGSRALMSGALDDRGMEGIKELGCRYFQKPFSFDEIAAWLGEREKLMDLSQRLGTRRKEKRAEANEAIECLVDNSEPVEGIVLNRSSLGLCLRIQCPVREGQTIAVRSGPFPSPRAASVKWVRAAGDGSYVTGLKYA
jgi:DNA-binding NtrC family response regulator